MAHVQRLKTVTVEMPLRVLSVLFGDEQQSIEDWRAEVDELIGEMQYVHAPGSDTYHAFRGCDRIRMIRPKPQFGKGDAAHECPDCAQLGVFSP